MVSPTVSEQHTGSGALGGQITNHLRSAAAGLQRLSDLEVSGRTMMTFMRGHMAEARRSQTAQEYFSTFYDSMGREFLQFDDYDFVVHHCVRYQFWHMKEEFDMLRPGPLGAVLADIGSPLPELAAPTTPGRRPPVAQGWYDDVYASLAAGKLPDPRGARNAVMPSEQCVMRDEEQLDLIWPQFLIWCGEVWGRQIIAAWQVLRSTIALRRMVEQMPARQVAQLVQTDEAEYRAAARSVSETYWEWHEFHATTVDVHDPMYDANLEGMFAWARSLAPDISVWGIKDATKDEMYLELAANVLRLRGREPTVDLPEFSYWRRTQFVPACNRKGAPGMPPFVV